MKKNNYFFTRLFIFGFVAIGLILAVFPGLQLKSTAYLLNSNEVYFETFIPTYKSIFGGSFSCVLQLQESSLAYKDNPEIINILSNTYAINIKTNILILIFLILSILSVLIFLVYAKSRIVSVITSIILIITTITFATSNISFNYELIDQTVITFNLCKLSLGFVFLLLSFAIATGLSLFHLFRVLKEPDSLEQESNQNLKD